MSAASAPRDERQLPLALEPEQGDLVPSASSVVPAGTRERGPSLPEARSISDEDLKRLTPNERRVVELAARGHTDKQIAHLLNRSYRTVQTLMQVIRHKLGMRTRFEFGFHARKLLNPGEPQ